MTQSLKIRWQYRLQKLATSWRVLRLNLQHGWTTEAQRGACFGAGYDAVLYETHRPPNPNVHPLLIQEFDDGAELARECLADDAAEEYMGDIQDTYDAIQRGEMNDIYVECRELGLVGSSGPGN